jgi:hypothetical protein
MALRLRSDLEMLNRAATAPTPPTGSLALYFKNGFLTILDEFGAERQLSSGGHEIIDSSGALLPSRVGLQFLGASVSDDPGDGRTIVAWAAPPSADETTNCLLSASPNSVSGSAAEGAGTGRGKAEEGTETGRGSASLPRSLSLLQSVHQIAKELCLCAHAAASEFRSNAALVEFGHQ